MTTYSRWQNIFEISLGITKKLSFGIDQQLQAQKVPFWKDVLQIWGSLFNR